jgi:hypothetical protein
VTNPLDESRPIADSLRYMEALVTEHDLDEFDDAVDDKLAGGEQRERGWEVTEGPEAWARVEALVDRAIAERAQRVVDRILERRRREQGRPGFLAHPIPSPHSSLLRFRVRNVGVPCVRNREERDADLAHPVLSAVCVRPIVRSCATNRRLWRVPAHSGEGHQHRGSAGCPFRQTPRHDVGGSAAVARCGWCRPGVFLGRRSTHRRRGGSARSWLELGPYRRRVVTRPGHR